MGCLLRPALVALIAVVFGGGAATSLSIALLLFVIAAIVGFVLFSYHLKSRPLPIPTMVTHALFAVVAFVILIVVLLRAT